MEKKTAVKKAEKKNPSILIVDDVNKNLQLMATILLDKGFDIRIASNGKQAISSLEQESVDLILLDVMMPEMDGFEVCKRIKSSPDTANIPILFLTAKTEVTDKVRGFEIGGADYITKPFDPIEVIARINAHLQLKLANDTIMDYNDRLEEMLQERTHELIMSERQATIGQLIQGIVHNLRGPLTVIGPGSQMIKMKLGTFEEIRNEDIEDGFRATKKTYETIKKYADLIEKSFFQLNGMISSLMSKSRTDKSSEFEIVDLSDLVNQELDFLQANLHFKHNVMKDINLSDDSINIQVVPSEITQIIQNLIKNSLDAMYDQEEPVIFIKTWISDGIAKLSIGDNGPGIPNSIITKLFDPFFTTKPKEGAGNDEKPTGTGLGLYMCHETLTTYDGKIEVASEIGHGAKFTISLPLYVATEINPLDYVVKDG